MRILGAKHLRAMLLARFLACASWFFLHLTFAAEPLLLEEARLVPSAPSPPGFGNSVAIDGNVAVGRYVDAQNYYYLTQRNSNQISLKKLTSGAITALDTAALSAPMTVNTWYNRRLDTVGTKLRAYMNGVSMLEATDQSHHPAGYAGVAAYKTAAEADDFLVVHP